MLQIQLRFERLSFCLLLILSHLHYPLCLVSRKFDWQGSLKERHFGQTRVWSALLSSSMRFVDRQYPQASLVRCKQTFCLLQGQGALRFRLQEQNLDLILPSHLQKFRERYIGLLVEVRTSLGWRRIHLIQPFAARGLSSLAFYRQLSNQSTSQSSLFDGNCDGRRKNSTGTLVGLQLVRLYDPVWRHLSQLLFCSKICQYTCRILCRPCSQCWFPSFLREICH